MDVALLCRLLVPGHRLCVVQLNALPLGIECAEIGLCVGIALFAALRYHAAAFLKFWGRPDLGRKESQGLTVQSRCLALLL